MKLRVAVASLLMLTTVAVHAQSDSSRPGMVSFELGVTPGYFLQQTGSSTHFILGGDMRIQQMFSKNRYAWTLTGTVTKFFAFSYRSILFALKPGLKIFVAPKFFVSGEIGVGRFSQGGKFAFVYAPSVGRAPNKKWNYILTNEWYTESPTPFSQLGLRVGYRF